MSEDVRFATDVMARHAKTFAWANRLMPEQYRQDFAVLYTFCRVADDCVDEATDRDEAREKLDAIRDDLRSARGTLPVVAAFLRMAERRSVPLRVADELLVGIASDAGSVRVADWRQLHRYAYRVASTVGLMVCSILDVRGSEARAYAIDLGIGMQLTNITRDVAEDFAADRIYLPAAEITEPCLASAIAAGDERARRDVFSCARRVLENAAEYYRSADHGIAYLPRWSRWGILTASRCYEDIGHVLRRRGPAALDRRASTSKLRKSLRTLQAFALVRVDARYRRPGCGGAEHDARLHRHLAGLPDAHVPSDNPDGSFATPGERPASFAPPTRPGSPHS